MEYLIVIDLKKTGENIKKLMETHDLSAKDVAEELNLAGVQAIYRWIHGETLPQIDHLVMLTRLFGVSCIDDILIKKEIKN